MERVWDLVTSEKDIIHLQKLSRLNLNSGGGWTNWTRDAPPDHIRQGVVLLHDFDRGSVGNLGVVCYLDSAGDGSGGP